MAVHKLLLCICEVLLSINRDAKEKAIIMSAMAHIQTETCIQFVEANLFEVDHVVFTKSNPDGDGCYSHLGRRGGRQRINLGYSHCINRGTIVHEILHTLGVYHEHTRPDRDKFIHIVYDNMKPDSLVHRDMDKRHHSELTDFGLPYDYSSIMHYHPYAMAKAEGLTTIVPINPMALGVSIGQRNLLSNLDARKLRLMYQLVDVQCDPVPQELMGVDEKLCQGFLCNNLQCVDKQLVCNGRIDCQDASDEKGCTMPAQQISAPRDGNSEVIQHKPFKCQNEGYFEFSDCRFFRQCAYDEYSGKIIQHILRCSGQQVWCQPGLRCMEKNKCPGACRI